MKKAKNAKTIENRPPTYPSVASSFPKFLSYDLISRPISTYISAKLGEVSLLGSYADVCML